MGVGKPQFFYAEITALTLGKVARMLGLTVKLPPPLDESGFPEGAAVSIEILPTYAALIVRFPFGGFGLWSAYEGRPLP